MPQVGLSQLSKRRCHPPRRYHRPPIIPNSLRFQFLRLITRRRLTSNSRFLGLRLITRLRLPFLRRINSLRSLNLRWLTNRRTLTEGFNSLRPPCLRLIIIPRRICNLVADPRIKELRVSPQLPGRLVPQLPAARSSPVLSGSVWKQA
jgi:hypothetical protein